MQISDILTKTRRKELDMALNKCLKDSDLVIQTRIKRKELKSNRGSLYRGVSRNGKKWQVRNISRGAIYSPWSIIGSTARQLEEALYWVHQERTQGG
jgi:hypothetical protein